MRACGALVALSRFKKRCLAGRFAVQVVLVRQIGLGFDRPFSRLVYVGLLGFLNSRANRRSWSGLAAPSWPQVSAKRGG